MFSGIITNLQKAIKISRNHQEMELTLSIPKSWNLTAGESINIDGVCSTVKRLNKKTFTVYYMPETLRKTGLNNLKEGHLFNLERSLTLNTLIGGHLVTGHIDTVAEVKELSAEGEAKIIKFKIKPEFSKYIIYKGSICINGVSLTIVDVIKEYFTVSLIPYTLEQTNLGLLEAGDQVNIEVDLISKYVEKFTSATAA